MSGGLSSPPRPANPSRSERYRVTMTFVVELKAVSFERAKRAAVRRVRNCKPAKLVSYVAFKIPDETEPG